MKPRKRHLTAQIKPATKHALMAQLALAADMIIAQREQAECHGRALEYAARHVAYLHMRPWWRRLLGLR